MNLSLRRRQGFIISLARGLGIYLSYVLFKQTEVEEGLIKIL